MTPPVIHLENIYKSYTRHDVTIDVLRDVSLEVEKGEFVAITGHSGSGKSTLLNLVGCLDNSDNGRYLLNGTDITRFKSDDLAHIRNNTFGFIFQNFGLLPRTSALENVETPLMYAGMTGDDRRSRAEQLLKKFDLGDRIHHLPSQLSGGQQQRVAIARALVNNPLVLLADEPTGNLDSAMGEEIITLIEELNASQGLTVVLITHELHVAQRAHRRLNLTDGRLDA